MVVDGEKDNLTPPAASWSDLKVLITHETFRAAFISFIIVIKV